MKKRTVATAFASLDDSDDDESKVPVNAKLPRNYVPPTQNVGIVAQKQKHVRSFYWLEQHQFTRPKEESGNSNILGSEGKADAQARPLKWSTAPRTEQCAEERREVVEAIEHEREANAMEDFRSQRRVVGGTPICHLCKRKFASFDKLEEHEDYSQLHKQNLAKNEREDDQRDERSENSAITEAPSGTWAKLPPDRPREAPYEPGDEPASQSGRES